MTKRILIISLPTSVSYLTVRTKHSVSKIHRAFLFPKQDSVKGHVDSKDEVLEDYFQGQGIHKAKEFREKEDEDHSTQSAGSAAKR